MKVQQLIARKIIPFFTVILVSGFSVPAAQAEPLKFEFDKVHSQILFFADHLGFSISEGEFHDYDGHIMFDRARPENSSVEVTIKTDSIDMDSKPWDDSLKSEHFFNVAKYPEMTFKSTGIKITGDNTADITGDFTMLGVTKPVVLHTTHHKTGKSPFDTHTIVTGFSAVAEIDRSAWGMTYGMPMMSPKVDIRLEVEADHHVPEGSDHYQDD